jgi:DNA-binding CsgD family transcriptional regulator
VRSAEEVTEFRLPQEVREACVELKKTWASSANGSNGWNGTRRAEHGGNGHSLIVRHRPRPEAQALVRLIPDETTARPVIAVVLQDARTVAGNGSHHGHGAQLGPLSAREQEVVSLLCRGKSNKDIAAHLGKSVLTVKTQLHSIYAKLGTTSRGELMPACWVPSPKNEALFSFAVIPDVV